MCPFYATSCIQLFHVLILHDAVYTNNRKVEKQFCLYNLITTTHAEIRIPLNLMLQLCKQYSMHSHTRHTALLSRNSINIITDQEYNL